jgi:hypothetical protein
MIRRGLPVRSAVLCSFRTIAPADMLTCFHSLFFISPGRAPLNRRKTNTRRNAGVARRKSARNSSSVRSRPAVDKLEVHFAGLALQFGFGSGPEDGAEVIGDRCDGSPESLFHPILWEAVYGINFYAVAEAILRDRRKWSPERGESDAARAEGGKAAQDGDGGAAVSA